MAIDDEDRRATVLGAGFEYRAIRAFVARLGYQRIRVDRLRPKVTFGFIPDVPNRVPIMPDWTYTDLEDVSGWPAPNWDATDNLML